MTGGRTVNLSAEGPWALFRLLDKATVEQASTADRFEVTFDVEGLTAEFDLRASSVVNPFRLGTISGFRCRDRL